MPPPVSRTLPALIDVLAAWVPVPVSAMLIRPALLPVAMLPSWTSAPVIEMAVVLVFVVVSAPLRATLPLPALSVIRSLPASIVLAAASVKPAVPPLVIEMDPVPVVVTLALTAIAPPAVSVRFAPLVFRVRSLLMLIVLVAASVTLAATVSSVVGDTVWVVPACAPTVLTLT